MITLARCNTIFLFIVLLAGAVRPQSSIPAFPLRPNDLELTRLAQPGQYFDKIGPRAGLMGFESGQFEAWVWPWKPLRNFELQFLLGTSTQPILARDIVRTVSVTPEVTTLTYTYESFTVKEHIFIPRNEPGAILLLDIRTTEPLAVIPGFVPVMQPMWPAGVGGQFSYWDDAVNGYVIAEGQWRAEFICGSPAGRQMAAPPAHMFADNPLQFRIDVKPGETDGKFIPIVIAGALPDTVSWKMSFDSVKATYERLWKNAERYYNACADYYRDLRASTVRIVTPDPQVNLAYEWGKVALDNLMIDNPRLGHGMVAGFGLSGGGARPGFAWFFGGDAFINSMAMNAAGMFRQSRDALAFCQKWQRQENLPVRKKNPADPPKDVGKMSHELSQSDGLCDWWNDYHYGYNHADTSPWYVVAMGDYTRSSGDTAFLRQSWASVKAAYAWCLSKDSDGDGLMDLKGAGLGALEFGKLVGIYADVYTCGVFAQAVREMRYMAERVGDTAAARQALAQWGKVQPQLEKKFWLEKEGFYAYGATEKGEQVHEKTPWAGVAMMFGLLDEGRTAKAIAAMNGADLCTDWGVRTLSNRSALFEPTNYNYGAVWPFIASFFNTAQFRYGEAMAAYPVLRANIGHAFDHALGSVPEVFSGALNEKLGEGYHHQGFSTTGYMLPLVRGLVGLGTDGAALELRPSLPASWKRLELGNVRPGGGAPVGMSVVRTDTSLRLTMEEGDSVSVMFAPEVPFGAMEGADAYIKVHGRESAPRTMHRGSTIERARSGGFRLTSPAAAAAVPGGHNAALKIVHTENAPPRFRMVVEGKPGLSYVFPIEGTERIATVAGGVVENGQLVVKLAESPGKEFVRGEITITLK